MKILKNVEEPNRRAKYCAVTTAILDFIESDDVNIKFECEDKNEAKTVYCTAGGAARSMKLPVRVVKSGNDIYVLRKAE